ncbi:MAG: BREX-1 system adenine-specific DNA-methyltransferase PglX [Nannocystaceae bacterium]
MKHTQLKRYAPEARRNFIAAVGAQARRIGITASGEAANDAAADVRGNGGEVRVETVALGRAELVARVQADGWETTLEAIAYTWFNRFAALRYMELHGYLDHGYRVLSRPAEAAGVAQYPEIVDHAIDVDLPGLDPAKVAALQLDGTQDERLYRMLLVAQCNALHQAMPFLFERIGSADELLLPANLLHTDSIIRQLVEGVDERAWEEIEVVGWLYQFYISEKKEQVIGKVVAPEDLPAATQLFTPSWIVKYMVHNSLGAQWMATYPNSPLRSKLDYYIDPADPCDEVHAKLAALTPETLDPETLTLLDPASGSGHILVEAYDLFKEMYLERGYRQRDVAKLILEKNLYGLDIDERAAQLTGFALMMKGRADDQRLFTRDVKLNVVALVKSDGVAIQHLTQDPSIVGHGIQPADLDALAEAFEQATTFGALIRIPEALAAGLPALGRLGAESSGDLFVASARKHLAVLVRQAQLLAAQYDAVVANPPYMGSKSQPPVLKAYLKRRYEHYRKDLFSAFIDRNLAFSKRGGRLGFMSPFVWMFLSSHEQLRERLIEHETITSLVQLEVSAFRGAGVSICAFALQKARISGYKGSYIRLSDFPGPDNQAPKTREAIENRDCGWLFEVDQADFRRIEGSPVAYWVSARVREAFATWPRLADSADARQGLATSDNDAFLRLWWEVDIAHVGLDFPDRTAAEASGLRWFPHSKGGGFRRWYGNREYVVDWEHDGARIKRSILRKYPYLKTPDFVAKNPRLYFHPFVSWSLIGTGAAGFRWEPRGTVFGHKGPGVFLRDPSSRSAAMGFLNSKVCVVQLGAISPTIGFEVGQVRQLAADLRPDPIADRLVDALIELAKADWDARETSWDFGAHAWAPTDDRRSSTMLATSWARSLERSRHAIDEMRRLEQENNTLFIRAYGLGAELGPEVPTEQITLTANPAYRYGAKTHEKDREPRFLQDSSAELVSYAVGCMMGRYSLDQFGLIYAGSGNAGYDAGRYRSFPPADGGMMPIGCAQWFDDDAYHRLVRFVAQVWDGSRIEENLRFLAESLSPKTGGSSSDVVRRYLGDKFFQDHTKAYKKRPIYWLFSSGKCKAFQCLVYLHRYNEGTLSRMRNAYVIPLQGKFNARLDRIGAEISAATSTAHGKRLVKERTALERQQVELLAFDPKLRHLADQRIALDLDAGVKCNYGRFGDLLADVKLVHGKVAAS